MLGGQGGHLPIQLLLDQVYKNQVADFLFDCFLDFSRSFIASESGFTCTNLSQVFSVASAYNSTTEFRPFKLQSFNQRHHSFYILDWSTDNCSVIYQNFLVLLYARHCTGGTEQT